MVNGRIPNEAELRALVDSIREEQLNVWGYEESLRNLGF
jgi:hypothetical protein